MSQALTVRDPVLARFDGAVIRGKLALHLARFELEADRLIIYQQSRWLMGFGLLGLLLAKMLKGTRIDLPFAHITTVARGKYGLNKKILDVTMADGTVHRLNIYDDKAALIRAQLAQRCRLTDEGNERWQVSAA